MVMENKKETFHQTQQGSGSAENIGQDRSSQVNQTANLSEPEKEDIAAQIGEDPGSIADLKEMGALSGRDDLAGGSGDRMEEESTGSQTDR